MRLPHARHLSTAGVLPFGTNDEQKVLLSAQSAYVPLLQIGKLGTVTAWRALCCAIA